MRVALLVPAIALILAAAPTSAQRRAALPAWSPGLDVDALAAGAGVTLPATTRVTLSGTVTSTLDGERYDALHRITDDGGQRVPFVVLPADARVVEEDYEAHTYVVELRRGRELRVDPSVISARSLHTVSEIRGGLRGAIVVDVAFDPAAADAALADAAAGAEAPPISTTQLAGYGALAVAPPMLLLLAFGAYRRRRRPAPALMRRIRIAVEAVDREARRLGPAFDPLRTASESSHDEARRLLRAYHDACDAKRRLSAIGGNGRQRFVDLDHAQRKALRDLEILCDRLEDTAVSLASHDARHANAGDVQAALASLGEELATAISADEEARQVA